jgi:uncharacterized protein (TIGR04255 family)
MAYKKAPITEAVLEFVFGQSVSQSVVESAARRVETDYPQKDIEETAQFQFDAQNKAAQVPAKWSWEGLKLSSKDRSCALTMRRDRFACIRLAPYDGWDAFRARANEGWTAWKKSAGVLEVKRVGLRYINRIDIPSTANQLINIEEYLNIGPKMPNLSAEPIISYTVQVSRPLGVDDCVLTLLSSSVASPLVGFASFAVDIDVSREVNIPRREDELWALVDRMRVQKNRIFEECITAKSRTLFQ